MVVVANEACGLELVDQRILLIEVPALRHGVPPVGPVPDAVEPDGTDGSVAGQQFRELVIHELEVVLPVPIRPVRAPERPAGPAARPEVGPAPVEVGVVEMELDAVLAAGFRQFRNHVPLERCRLDDIVVARLRVPHRKAVVMARSQRDVLRPGILDGPHPGVRVELRRIEARSQMPVLQIVQAPVVHHPFAVRHHRVDAPVDEHAEALVLERFPRRQILFRRHISRLRSQAQPQSEQHGRHRSQPHDPFHRITVFHV